MTALAWLIFAVLCATAGLLAVACRTNLEVSAENRRLRNRLASTERKTEEHAAVFADTAIGRHFARGHR